MTYREMRARLTPLYGEGEARAVADYVLSEAFGLSKADVICGAVEQMNAADTVRLEQMMSRLMTSEPVQYVVGFTEFASRRFNVAPGVLIPRPETEELCTWIKAESTAFSSLSILDVGTGSGCIACTLALDVKQSSVSAWDISAEALAIARANAAQLDAHVDFIRQDALNAPVDSALWDIIVSNPPYICDKEKSGMASNVLNHEPHTALFVPDSDPLLFYRSISHYAVKALRPQGRLYFEINPLYANDIKVMLATLGFENIVIKRDQWQRERMVRAVRG